MSEERTGASAAAPKLDDLMLAMDVVDTLRHEQSLVERELDQASRDDVLKKRLREIYEGQGLEVSERILDEGIEALKESRFTYQRKGSALKRKVAMLWVQRRLVGSIFAALALVGVVFLGNWWWQSSSARQEAEASRIELTETLPSELNSVATAARTEARTEDAKNEIEALQAEAANALSRSDRARARRAVADLKSLRDDLSLTYNLVIVQRGQSAVETTPDVNPNARNYYLLVEAIAPDGSKLSREITNEETGERETVDMWGVRVPHQTYLSVRDDKLDDGIIQDRILGVKQRGALKPVYSMPVSGGSITNW
ncbi:MAG: DUF6384 family protein [Methyloceanibacter sp.]|nr:DUF6384 family protein [Methyloceanibacter sp.]